ncbi:uncharacterized protein LOC131269651 isoform X2 [Anopheles coustani]|uniref:uncharacterized protein LOC131269651 isoform X2 n=1 Tax=Anopheles coustani TaxID=139045 RepID=UPI002659E63F|nr:uncharacterized protein LOC131269651 isoform X2 [Anopheles coustani]
MRLSPPKAESIITVSSGSSSSVECISSPRKPSVTVLSNVKLRSATDDPEPTTQLVRPVRPSGLHRYDGKRARINTPGEGHPAVNSLGVGLETSVIRKTPHPPASPVRPSSSREHTTSTATESQHRRHRRITLTARMSTGGKVESHKRHQAVVATKQRCSPEVAEEEIELEPILAREEDLPDEGDEEEEDDDDEDDDEEEVAEESDWEDDPGQNGGSGSGGGQQSGHSSSDNKENDRKYQNTRQGGRQGGNRKRKEGHSSNRFSGNEMSRCRRGRRDIPQQLVKLEPNPESEPPAVYHAIVDQEPPLLPRASLECFEMVDATAMVEVEVETEDLVDRKPTESMLSQDAVLYSEDRTMSSSISSFAELCEMNAMQAAATPVKIEGMLFQAQQQPATMDAQPATVIPTTPPPVAGDDVIVETDPRTPPASIEQHRDVKDFLEVGGPSLSSTSKFAGAAGAFEQHSGAGAAAGVHRPASYYRQSYDVKDFLEAGPSSRAASESVVGPIASSGASDGDRRQQQQHPFQLYSHADVDYASEFHRALSTNSAFTSGASSPDDSEAVPGVWAHRFSPQYSSAVLAANGGLLGSADRSASASPIGAHNGGAGNGGGHGTAASYGEDNSSMEEEEDTDITGTDDKPAVTNAAISTSRHSSSAMSLASSIVSCSMERAPSTESLNIRTDEKMPAKGEISEQESNGDMELTPWKRLCAVSENIPVYPSSYDYSTAQECWNLSNRLGTHSAAISRMPFPFSSGSQASLTNYPSRGSVPVGGYKKEVVGDEDEDDYDEDDVPGEDEDEEERERSGSMKSTIPKVPFGELGANLELQLHQDQQQHQQQVVEQSAILVPYVEGMREEKYLPKGTGALDFEEFAPSSHHYGPTKARTTGPSGSRGSSKPSGSGIPRTYRCVKCMEPFSSIKQRREHMRSVHPEEALQLQTQPGELQHHQQQQQQLELSLPSELLGSGLLTEDVKTGVTGEKPPPEPLAPVVMDYHWLRQEIQRKYELGAQPSNTLVLMTPTTTVVRKRLFVCAVCRAEFERFNQFNAHLMVHPAECMACGRHFKQWRNFALHLKRHLGIKEHGCRVCGKHFVIKQKLIEHMRVHSGHAPIRCKLCNRHFKRFSNLAQHSNRYHLNKVAVKHEYVCSQCGDVFPTRAKMEWHKETHEQKPKPCPYCREKFIHQNSLTRHIRLSHTLQYAKLKNKTEPCTVCQQPYTKASMRRHMETHTEERLVFSCGICNKHFTTNWNLKQHKWTHANPTMKPFQCTLCPAGFVRESDYLTHVNAHRSIRPYTCNHCGRQFIRKYNWLRHSREHETDKSHKCDECGRQFHRKYYLTEHKRMHSGERPYACNICGKTSSTKTNHNKHCLARERA